MKTLEQTAWQRGYELGRVGTSTEQELEAVYAEAEALATEAEQRAMVEGFLAGVGAAGIERHAATLDTI